MAVTPTTWALIPARDFATAKSRLGWTPDRRAALARELLERTIAVVRPRVSGVLVCTDAAGVVDVAEAAGCAWLRDPPGASFSEVIDGGLAHLWRRGVTRAVVIMADLPLLAGADVDALLDAVDGDVGAIAPDRHGLGTNAVVLTLSPGDRTCFGHPDSFLRHQARRPAAVVRRPGLGLDLDVPEDLAALQARCPGAPPPLAPR